MTNLTLVHDRADDATVGFDHAYADLVRAWTTADDLRRNDAPYGERSVAAAALLRARQAAHHARLRLTAA